MNWQQHKDKWIDCDRCSLCEHRHNVVLARGMSTSDGKSKLYLPSEILIIGEAPGPSEDLRSKPFIGPAGKILDKMLDQALRNAYSSFAYEGSGEYPKIAFTNLVACIPKGEDNAKFTEPPKEAILACASRLVEFIDLCKPKLIFRVGKLSMKWLHLGMDSSKWVKQIYGKMGVGSIALVDILHPAAILRMDISQQGLAIQRTIVEITDALVDLRDKDAKAAKRGRKV